MGWYYTNGATKADIIRELTTDSEHIKTLAHAIRGNVLWTVQETPSGKFIGCYLLNRAKDEAGYKPMEESMHPYFYSCPLSYLEMAPEANAEWREGVRKWHAKRNQKLAIGQTVKLVNSCKPNVLTVTSLKPLRGRDDHGNLWRIPRRLLA